MSEDESPSGGHQQPNTEYDSNNSIIGKVRSKVSSIIPQTFTKWFSPNRGNNSRNGNLRRRREEMLDGDAEDSQNTDDSDSDNRTDNKAAPPLKRTKLNDGTTMDNYEERSQNVDRNFLLSTPASIRRKNLASTNNQKDTPYSFEGVAASTFISSGRKRSHIPNEDAIDAEISYIPEKRYEPNWDNSHKISSRRSLNIPSSSAIRDLPELRHNKVISSKSMRSKLAHYMCNFNEHEEPDIEEQEESVFDEEEKTGKDDTPVPQANRESSLLTNGIRSSPEIVVQVDTASESSESQCSSLQRQKTSGLLTMAPKSLRTSVGSGLNFYSHLEGKKSLFSEKNMPSILNNSTTSLTSLNRRQSFNASLYGSTSALSDSRLLNISSPFYKGRTTYGGASAYSKFVPQIQRTLHKPTLVRPTSSLSTLSSSNTSLGQGVDTSQAISNTAKRILELMNQFTTPLADAKKMANNVKNSSFVGHKKRFGDMEMVDSRAIKLSSPKTPYSRITTTQLNCKDTGPPINELHVPTMSQLLQMKKLQSNTEKVREIANSSKSILNRGEEYKLPTAVQNNDRTNKHINKIKNKVSNVRSSGKNTLNEDEILPAVNLPDIPLPLMKSVPKIDISISSTLTSTSSISNTSSGLKNQSSTIQGYKNMETNSGKSISIYSNNTKVNQSPSLENQKENIVKQVDSAYASDESIVKKSNDNVEFKFSVPIKVAAQLKTPVEPINNFKFSEPVPVNNSILKNFKYQENEKLAAKECGKTIDSSNQSKKNLLSAAPQLKCGSVLEALQKPLKPVTSENNSTLGFGTQFKMASDKWECSVCMIRNDNTRATCEACQTPKKSTSAPANSDQSKIELKTSTNSFGNTFKPKANTWECPTCMIRNENDITMCQACSTKKPGVAAISNSSSSVPKTIDSGFKSIVAQQASKWECSVCMTRNEPNRSKCVCCEQLRPNAVSDDAPAFSFGASSSKFTFGFVNQKEEDLKKVTESQNTDTDKQKKTDKEPSGFTFGIPSSTSITVAATPTSFSFKSTDAIPENQSKDKDVVDSPPSGEFKFGLPIQNKINETNKVGTGFPFDLGNQTQLAAIKGDNVGETGGFKFTLPAKSETAHNSNKSREEVKNENKSAEKIECENKPVGGFNFVQPNKVESTPVVNKSEQHNPSTFTFGTTTTTTTTSSSFGVGTGAVFTKAFPLGAATIEKPDSTADSKTAFKFSTTPLKGNGEPKNSTSESGFTFGSNTSKTSSTPFANAFTQQKVTATSSLFAPAKTVTSSSNTTNTASTFIFGKPVVTTNTSSTPSVPLFGAVSSSTVTTTSTVIMGTSVLSSTTASAAAPTAATTSLFSSPLNKTISTGSFGSLNPQQTNAFGSSSFSASSSENTSTNNQSNNLFAFGANKNETNKSIFGNVSSTTNKTFAFGSNIATSNTPAPFSFGSNVSKPEESTPVFGTASSNAGNATNAPLPSFGSFSSPAPINSQPQTNSIFGQSTNNVITPFGGNNPAPFGASSQSTPIFGNTTFGNSPFANTNNATFGSSSATSIFDSGFNSDGPAAKKQEPAFNFGAAAQSTTGFSFGSNNNNSSSSNNNNNTTAINKPAFNFSTTAPKSFNFTGSQEGTNKPLFQFGATPATSTPGVFNFSGVETTPNAPPFQFGATPAANNIFAPTPTPGTPSSQARRKFRQGARGTKR